MKSIAIVGTQIVLAAGVITMGIIVLVGSDFQAQRLLVGEIGDVGRMVVGAVQVVAGLCLMLPRGHVIGTLLLALLTVGIMGVMIGRAAEGNAARAAAPKQVSIHSAVANACERGSATPLRQTPTRELAI